MSYKHELKKALTEAHSRMSYDDISKNIFKGKVSGATIWKIVIRNKWPRSRKLRRLLCMSGPKMLSKLPEKELLRRIQERTLIALKER